MKKLVLILIGLVFYSGTAQAANLDYLRFVSENTVPNPASGMLLLMVLVGLGWKTTRKTVKISDKFNI